MRPPLKPVLEEPMSGKSITEAFEKATARFPSNAFGKKVVDYYRYPDNLSGEKMHQ